MSVAAYHKKMNTLRRVQKLPLLGGSGAHVAYNIRAGVNVIKNCLEHFKHINEYERKLLCRIAKSIVYTLSIENAGMDNGFSLNVFTPPYFLYVNSIRMRLKWLQILSIFKSRNPEHFLRRILFVSNFSEYALKVQYVPMD